MTRRTITSILAILLALGAAPLAAQRAGAPVDSSPQTPTAPPRFYDAADVLTVMFTANFGRLRRDKQDGAPWRAASLTHVDSTGRSVTLPIRARTRGLWRLRECGFPPLRIDFADGTKKGTVFAGLDRPKLVTHCRDDDRSEQYVLGELQLYRIYNLLTPHSHRARLLRIAYVDSASGETETTRHAIMLEEPEALAERVGGTVIEQQGADADDLDPYSNALLGVFQYLIGNTDWSISGLHNAELISIGYVIHPVAYDFDFSGAVDTHYATPPPQLRLRSVRQRLFRGYCAPEEEYARVFALFNERRPAITALYHDEIGRLLAPRTVERTLEYFDEFYRTINDPGAARRAIVEACLRAGG